MSSPTLPPLPESADPLTDLASVQEQPFRSQTPLIGGLIARFRQFWNSISTQWYVRPLLAQQNRFNHALLQRVQEQEARLIQQDRELSALTRDHAELTAQVVRLTRQWQEQQDQA
jgi:hypothetical protein